MFPQCIGKIDGTHIKIAKPNKRYQIIIAETLAFSGILHIQGVCET